MLPLFLRFLCRIFIISWNCSTMQYFLFFYLINLLRADVWAHTTRLIPSEGPVSNQERDRSCIGGVEFDPVSTSFRLEFGIVPTMWYFLLNLFIYLFMDLFVCLFVCLFVYLFIYTYFVSSFLVFLLNHRFQLHKVSRHCRKSKVEGLFGVSLHIGSEGSCYRQQLTPGEKSHRDNSRVHLDQRHSHSMSHKCICNNSTGGPLKMEKSSQFMLISHCV